MNNLANITHRASPSPVDDLQSLAAWSEVDSPPLASNRAVLLRFSHHGGQIGYEFNLNPQQASDQFTRLTYPAQKGAGKMKFYATQEIGHTKVEPEPLPIEALPEGKYFDAIVASIQKSSFIPELGTNWDGEGGQPIKKDTWDRAIFFLLNYARWARTNAQVLMSAPKIFPTSEGGIDLSWRRDSYSLVIRIPSEMNEKAEYAGRLPDGEFREGYLVTNNKFNDSEHWALLQFLKNG